MPITIVWAVASCTAGWDNTCAKKDPQYSAQGLLVVLVLVVAAVSLVVVVVAVVVDSDCDGGAPFVTVTDDASNPHPHHSLFHHSHSLFHHSHSQLLHHATQRPTPSASVAVAPPPLSPPFPGGGVVIGVTRVAVAGVVEVTAAAVVRVEMVEFEPGWSLLLSLLFFVTAVGLLA